MDDKLLKAIGMCERFIAGGARGAQGMEKLKQEIRVALTATSEKSRLPLYKMSKRREPDVRLPALLTHGFSSDCHASTLLLAWPKPDAAASHHSPYSTLAFCLYLSRVFSSQSVAVLSRPLAPAGLFLVNNLHYWRERAARLLLSRGSRSKQCVCDR